MSNVVTHPNLPSKYGRLLILLFICTLPLVNPWVRGDGVGYYAYVRSLLIQHNLQFEKDWLVGQRNYFSGAIPLHWYTATGHLNNHFTVGPSILWAPFLTVVHLAVLGFDKLGGHIPADGFSWPYIVTMATTTAFYGFLGLYFSFQVARRYFEERWALLGTIGIWFASSLPMYMYLNPSWSHAHSAFAVALFFWYWQRTRGPRTPTQWAILGLLSGLMLDVYYPNAVLLLLVVWDSVAGYARALRLPGQILVEVRRLFLANVLYVMMVVLAFMPTLITRQIIYGHPFDSGYDPPLREWWWTSPVFAQVLFSSNHGLLSWTPILILAVLGLVFLWNYDKSLAASLLVVFVVFAYLISVYPVWHGQASFGNRFFVSLTTIFVFGLSATFSTLAKAWQNPKKAFLGASVITAVLILWNLGLIFQYGTLMIPARGPISWKLAAYNQVVVVPVRLTHVLKRYLVARTQLMEYLEQGDAKQLKSQQRTLQKLVPAKE